MYAGREWDNDIQQYHYRGRMYDSGLGRFCSRDPSGYRGGIGLYINYLLVSFIDPFGLWAYPPDEIQWPKSKVRPSTVFPPIDPNAPPGPPAPVCVHNTMNKKRCFFPMLSPTDPIDEWFIQMGATGITEDMIPDSLKEGFPATPEGKKKILQIVKDRGCCEIIFAGHQGGNLNVGGICSKSPEGDPIPLLPDPDFETQLSVIMKAKCKSGCDVFQYSCGGSDPDDGTIARTIQQSIANNLGCTFWATERGKNYGITPNSRRKGTGQGDCGNSFDPTDWNPDPENPRRTWCSPFPMRSFQPQLQDFERQ